MRLPFLVTALLACAPALASDLTVQDAWVAVAPPGVRAHAAYVTASNEGDSPVAVIGVAAEGYGAAHLHESKETDGVATMTMLHQIVVPSGGTLNMVPGALHVMLMAPSVTQVEGETVFLNLTYDDGSTQAIDAVIRRNDAAYTGN